MINPFDPYGLYTDPNQLGVGKNIIGANKAVAPQQQPVGLLGIQPRQLPQAEFTEQQLDGNGLQMAANAFMKNKNPATDYALSAGGISEPGLKMPVQTGGNAMMPNTYDFQAPTNFGLDPVNTSGLGLFLNKYF
jgi:hypothetical protein